MPRPYAWNENNLLNGKRVFFNRQSNRLQGFDYSSPGSYFVTIVSYQRLPFFGKIISEKIQLNQIGKIVENYWIDVPLHFNCVSIDAFVIMPNHLHGIININEHQLSKKPSCYDSMNQIAPINFSEDHHKRPKGTIPNSLGAIIGAFKSATTKQVHRLGLTDHRSLWHRNYYEHIIRDDQDYHRIVEYIQLNPSNWANDQEFVLIW